MRNPDEFPHPWVLIPNFAGINNPRYTEPPTFLEPPPPSGSWLPPLAPPGPAGPARMVPIVDIDRIAAANVLRRDIERKRSAAATYPEEPQRMAEEMVRNSAPVIRR